MNPRWLLIAACNLCTFGGARCLGLGQLGAALILIVLWLLMNALLILADGAARRPRFPRVYDGP